MFFQQVTELCHSKSCLLAYKLRPLFPRWQEHLQLSLASSFYCNSPTTVAFFQSIATLLIYFFVETLTGIGCVKTLLRSADLVS